MAKLFALWTVPASAWAEYGLERAMSLNSTDIVGGMEKAMARAPEMSAPGPLIQAMASAETGRDPQLSKVDREGGRRPVQVPPEPGRRSAAPWITRDREAVPCGRCDCLRSPLVADLPGSFCFDV
jgi:hypothetical protein